MEGGDIEEEEEWGDGGPLGDPWGTLGGCRQRLGRKGWGSLETPGYRFFLTGKRIPSRPYRRVRGRPEVWI